MIVTVNISDKSFSVSVDEGRQTFKWLAGVIASRAKASQILRQDYEDDAFIVSGIKNVNGELIDPVDMIMEHSVGDSVVVTADIMSSFESDEWGNPIRGDWMTAGYVRSDSGKIWTDEMTAWRERLEKPSIAPVGSDVEVPIFSPRIKSSLVQIGEEFSLAEVESAFSLDAQLMSWTWAERMPPATLQSITDILRDNYALICNIFLHYCGVGKGYMFAVHICIHITFCQHFFFLSSL